MPEARTQQYRDILYEVRDPAAIITLNRPEVLNAWTMRMAAEVRHAAYRAQTDGRVVGIVITGAGRAFCSGADMHDLQGLNDAIEDLPLDAGDLDLSPPTPVPADFDGAYTWLLAVPKPVIAAINGPIAGMAVPIALCCDIRFMALDAPLITAFSHRGLIAEWGLAWLLPRLIGPSRALDLLYSSRRVQGGEAESMGLVNFAVPAEEVLARAIGYVEDLASRSSPTSMSIMKRQVYEQLTASLGPSEVAARRMMVESFSRPDFQEGVKAFLEKRAPVFTRLGEC